MLPNIATWALATIVFAGLTVPIYHLLRRWLARRETARMGRALSISHAIFTALEHVPDAFINRDLRGGLVLLLTHQLNLLVQTNPHHPHLRDLQQRVTLLNRMPSGLQRAPLRSKQTRRHANIALRELARLLNDAVKQGAMAHKVGMLARASAMFAAQQIAVDNARQAAKDAENVRAYPQALNFAYQAKGLCQKLPPLLGERLTEAVGQDIARLEMRLGAP